MSLFKKRHIQIKLVKDDTVPDAPAPSIEIPEEAISRVTRDVVNRITVGVVVVIGAAVVLTSAGKIAVNSVDNHQKYEKN